MQLVKWVDVRTGDVDTIVTVVVVVVVVVVVISVGLTLGGLG